MEGAKSFLEELMFTVDPTFTVVAHTNEVHSGRNKSMLVLFSFGCNSGKSNHLFSQTVESDAAAAAASGSQY